MAATLTTCRCGSDNRVRTSGIVYCPHCDFNVCRDFSCVFCDTLRRTCNDCRRTHATEGRRGHCESSHDPWR